MLSREWGGTGAKYVLWIWDLDTMNEQIWVVFIQLVKHSTTSKFQIILFLKTDIDQELKALYRCSQRNCFNYQLLNKCCNYYLNFLFLHSHIYILFWNSQNLYIKVRIKVKHISINMNTCFQIWYTHIYANVAVLPTYSFVYVACQIVSDCLSCVVDTQVPERSINSSSRRSN